MADPVSLLAVAGLIYAGRKLSEVPEQPKKVMVKEPELYDTEFHSRIENPKWIPFQLLLHRVGQVVKNFSICVGVSMMQVV